MNPTAQTQPRAAGSPRRETNPTKVFRFEIECMDGVFRPVSGTSHKADPDTGCRVFACSERGRPFEAYGIIAGEKNLQELRLMAHPRKVRYMETAQ